MTGGYFASRPQNQNHVSSVKKECYDALETFSPKSEPEEKAESVHSHSGTEDTENEFPSLVGKTYDMVEDPRTDNIICWADDGNGFVVRNSEMFCAKILPTYFRTKRFRSFVRNLNMYGFRSRKQAQEGVYRFKHPQFRRGKKHLLNKIRKKTTQKSILSDLRGSIKELRQNYAKLAKSHAKLEGILGQYTQILPLNMLQSFRKTMEAARASSVTPVVQQIEKKTPDKISKPHASAGTTAAGSSAAGHHQSSDDNPNAAGSSMSAGTLCGLKLDSCDIFGAPSMSPPFPFEGTQFSWPLLNPQA